MSSTEFYAALEALKDVHTREEREAARGRLQKAREKLMRSDPEFLELITRNRDRVRAISTEKDRKFEPMTRNADMVVSDAHAVGAKAEANAKRESTKLKKLGEEDRDKWIRENAFVKFKPRKS